MVGGILVNGREVLPNVLGARLVITVDNNNFLANSIPIRECIVSRITLWLFPSHHWSKGIPDFCTVSRRCVVPAGVGTILLVDAEIVSATSRTDEFPAFLAGFQLVQEVQD